MQGYADGEPAPAIDIGEPLQGGGALRATGDDLLRFFEVAIGGTDPNWDTVMTPRRDSPNGTNAQTGLLLNIEDLGTHKVYSKNGGAPSSQVTFRPPPVVVLLSNTKATEGLYRCRARSSTSSPPSPNSELEPRRSQPFSASSQRLQRRVPSSAAA